VRHVLSLSILAAACLAACATKAPVGDDAPTLASLATRTVAVDRQRVVRSDEVQAIAAYRSFLDSPAAAPRAPQRAEAMRRLGDLEMDLADRRSAEGQAAGLPDYAAAVARYRDYLRQFPDDRGNDRVLYQLARAQEQGGELEVSLATLDRLVQSYPDTAYREEAQFRRGELLFTLRAYAQAEQAYDAVLAHGGSAALRDRALYMQGWSRFKQGRLEEGLQAFFGVLDGKLANRGDEPLDSLAGLSRGDRELVDDTLRVMSISLTQLQGAESIAAYITSQDRRSYEFRVYQQLGELYIRQERVKDAADAFGAFVRRHPMHAQAPVLQARVIDIVEAGGFDTLALEARKEFVGRYGAASEFRRANPEGWAKVQALVRTRLAELARHYHASAQKTRSSADYQQAVHWYREIIAGYPGEPDTAGKHFLLGELLFEDGRFDQAAAEYEKTAYAYARHARSADAGYAALLAHAEQERRAAAAERAALLRAGVDSALRFAQTFDKDPRLASVLTDAADRLYGLKEAGQAQAVAERVLALDPPASADQRRVATTVLAHLAFESGAFDRAEKRYAEVLGLTPATRERDALRAELIERQAASIYKQGEAARQAGQAREAVRHFSRVAAVAPMSAIHASAQYDAAVALIGLKDWDGAARMLEEFRQRFPKHALVDEVSGQLALAWLEAGRWTEAAGEFERVAGSPGKDPRLVQEALWQAAELYAKGGRHAASAKAFERYLRQYAEPFERTVEARHRLALIAQADGDARRSLALQREIFNADQRGGASRTERTRFLGALAALALAEPAGAEYRKIALVEPLARSLKTKKARLEEALKAYAVAADYGVADVSTAATFHTAALYQDFGQAMLGSQRPKGLKKLEREQYDLMLEEQAMPFEDKAIALHEINARRSAQGVYDEWVRKSFAALRTLKPGRYARSERSTALEAARAEPGGDSAAQGLALREAGRLGESIAALERAVQASPKQALFLNQLGLSYRHDGRFAKAREAYEAALALDAQDADAHLNLGVLLDLYLGDGASALPHYERYLALTPSGDAQVGKWVADLKTRKPAGIAAADANLARKEP
jgi:cellulose synthase operon protein C